MEALPGTPSLVGISEQPDDLEGEKGEDRPVGDSRDAPRLIPVYAYLAYLNSFHNALTGDPSGLRAGWCEQLCRRWERSASAASPPSS